MNRTKCVTKLWIPKILETKIENQKKKESKEKEKKMNEPKEMTSSTVARIVCDKLIRFKVLNSTQTSLNT